MAEEIRWKQRFQNFNDALHQLTMGVELSRQRTLSDLERQGLIKAFEFVHELAWNVLKDFLEFEGIQGIIGSRGAVREAFKAGLIQDGDLWMEMIDKRNLSAHTYDLDLAAALASRITQDFHPAFLAFQSQMHERL